MSNAKIKLIRDGIILGNCVNLVELYIKGREDHREIAVLDPISISSRYCTVMGTYWLVHTERANQRQGWLSSGDKAIPWRYGNSPRLANLRTILCAWTDNIMSTICSKVDVGMNKSKKEETYITDKERIVSL